MKQASEQVNFTMASLEFNIPEGALWGDYFYEEFKQTSSVSVIAAADESDWETVGAKKISPSRMPKWCKHGNACIWRNCPFRHERCEHHDKWIASGKKTRGCRCLVTDPNSCKSPEDGGCKYDHRDVSKLQMFYKDLPVSTEAQLWEAFYQRGLEACSPNIYDTQKMLRFDRSLLIRSLDAAQVSYEDNGEWIEICAE